MMTIDPIAHVVTIPDETGVDQSGTFLDGLLEQSKTSLEAKVHLTFIQQALTLLAHRPLNRLKRDRIKLSITIEQKEYTKEYQLVKPLAKKPIFELRYPMNSNEHFRALFFPVEHQENRYYVFVKSFIKTKIPPQDETNLMRDLAYNMYVKVTRNPGRYLK